MALWSLESGLYLTTSLAQGPEPQLLAPETSQHPSPIRFQASCSSFYQPFGSCPLLGTATPGSAVQMLPPVGQDKICSHCPAGTCPQNSKLKLLREVLTLQSLPNLFSSEQPPLQLTTLHNPPCPGPLRPRWLSTVRGRGTG